MNRLLGGAASYPVAILVSSTIHLLLLVLLSGNWQTEEEPRRLIKPRFIEAKLLQIEAQPAAVKPKEKPKPKVDKAAERKKQLKRQQEKKRKQVLKRKKELDAKKKREQRKKEEERKRKLEQRRKEVEALKQQQLVEAIKEEQERLAALNEEQLANTYGAYVRDRIEANWSRPPSAKRDMVVLLEIQLLPNGKVVSAHVVESSGDEALDRSAEQVVLKIDRFDRLRELDNAVFERYFRVLTLEFKPIDLRL